MEETQQRDPSIMSPRKGWEHEALCRDMDSYDAELLFWHVDRRDPYKQQRRNICFKCPVQAECLAYGNDVSPDIGAWGGFNPEERRALIRKQS